MDTRSRLFKVCGLLCVEANVKEHATLSARARVDHGVDVENTEDHVNRAADRGCCVSTCSACILERDESGFTVVVSRLEVLADVANHLEGALSKNPANPQGLDLARRGNVHFKV